MRKYTGTSDGIAHAKRAGLEEMQKTLMYLFKAQNLGTFVVRNIKGKPGVLSVHSTGRAADIQPPSEAETNKLIAFLVDHAEIFQLEECHDYKDGLWGKGWRCSRRELDGKAGWKQWTSTDNGGSAGGGWCHYEISPEMADSPVKVKAAFAKIFPA